MSDDFPLMDAYLDALPDGLDSYPQCQSKASLLHSALVGHEAFSSGLPDVLRERIDSPPAPGFWIPAVHVIATVHAIIDVHYQGDEEATLSWGARRTAVIADNSLYRALLRVSSPRVFFSMSAKVNRLLQRGTKFKMEVLEDGRALARLRFPRFLHDRPSLLGTVAMCDTIVKLTGGVPKGTNMVEVTPTHALFDCRWE